MAKKIPFKLQFETEYRIVGLFCQERDYRTCWLLNKYLQFNFRKTIDFSYYLGKNQLFSQFSMYREQQEQLQRNFFLMNNQSYEGNKIFTSPVGLDFLLLIKADDSRFSYSELLKRLRSLPQITAAYLLDDALGRHKEGFLYDFEIFLSQELKM